MRIINPLWSQPLSRQPHRRGNLLCCLDLERTERAVELDRPCALGKRNRHEHGADGHAHAAAEALALALELAHKPRERLDRVAQDLGRVALFDELAIVVALGMIARHTVNGQLGAIDLFAIYDAAAHGAIAHNEVLGKRGEPLAKARVGHLHIGGNGAVGKQLIERHVGA